MSDKTNNQEAPKNPNLAIWDQVQVTPPAHTKEFNRGGGFKGTAINPTYMVRRATEIFGPIGKGWGVEIVDECMMEGAPIIVGEGNIIGKELVHKLRVKLWYILNGERCEIVQFGQTTFVGKNKYGPFTDEEAPKKSLTDGMTKCLSMLGFSADVHMGRYDDNKYVNDLRREAANTQRRAVEPPKLQPAQDDPFAGSDWVTWGECFVDEIKACKCQQEARDVFKSRQDELGAMKAEAPAVYARFYKLAQDAGKALPAE